MTQNANAPLAATGAPKRRGVSIFGILMTLVSIGLIGGAIFMIVAWQPGPEPVSRLNPPPAEDAPAAVPAP